MGTCYQPIERTPRQIDQDIALMKGAGFNVVRMGIVKCCYSPGTAPFPSFWNPPGNRATTSMCWRSLFPLMSF